MTTTAHRTSMDVAAPLLTVPTVPPAVWTTPQPDSPSTTEPSEARGPLRVAFVAGTGRSGSTLLGNILGSIPGAISVGEVKLGFRRGLVDGGFCGCRAPVRSCDVWSTALTQVFGTIPSAAEARRIDDELSRLVRTRRVPMWLAGREGSAADELSDMLANLLLALASVSGADVVVDSSKMPAYGALLARSDLLDVRVIHLVRDPRAVAWSWKRPEASHQQEGFEEPVEQFTALKSALMWLESSSTVPALWRHSVDHRLLLRYEDFVHHPRTELRSVAAFLGLTQNLAFVDEDSVVLKPSHAVAGNPNRVRSGPVRLHHDDEWARGMGWFDRAVVTAVTAPQRRRYGY